MTVPLANARLTGVLGPGYSPDFDRPAAPGPALWTGVARAYYRESAARNTTGSGSDVLITRELVVDSHDPDVAYRDGQTVTFEWGGTEHAGLVQAVARRTLPGHPLQTTRLTLELI